MKWARVLHRLLVRQAMPAAAVRYYERMSDAVAGFYLEPVCVEIEREAAPDARILDVGTGTGHLPALLASRNPRCRVTGVDLAPACIRAARRRAAAAGVSDRVDFVCGDVSAARGPFDLVVSTCSMHHWRYPRRELAGIARALTPSGCVWLLDDSADATDEERREWVRRVERAFDAGRLFRTVFMFESRHLAYGEHEVRALAKAAGLRVDRLARRDVFFVARLSLDSLAIEVAL